MIIMTHIHNLGLSRLLALILGVLLAMPVFAQIESSDSDVEEAGPNVVERLIEEADGNVNIIIDDSLLEKILRAPQGHKKHNGAGTQRIRPGINKVSGYRIQVFGDGRNQHSLEARAKARGTAISAKFPKYRGQVYTFSSSPNWYTRVGNFRTSAEANAALAELRSSFPAFANEMRIVKCQIVVIK